MQTDADYFQVDASARLLTPKATGAHVLLRALEERLSIKSSPFSNQSLEVVPKAKQRIYCESSGSTGQPKLIRRSPSSWIASFAVNKHSFGICVDDAYGILGHLGHSLGLYATLEALHCGAGVALLAGMQPAQQWSALFEHQITAIYATPSQLRVLIATDQPANRHVRRILCGGGHLDQGLRALLRQQFPNAQVLEFFGASETSFMTISDDQTPAGSVGSAYPGVSLQIGPGCNPGEIGEIWVKSPYLFEGYSRGESSLTRWQDGYLAIGELGQLDDAGNLYLQGRRSRMVTVADQNVFPEAIEAVLMAQSGVESAAVFTPPDPLRGHVIIAAVVGNASDATLRQACRRALGDAAVPRRIWRIEALPLLAAGKPDLKRLETLWGQRKT